MSAPAGAPTPVFAIYQRRRIEGYFDPSTGALAIPIGPGAGRYKTPSGAARAVISELRPQVSPIRTGWTFWRLSETGAPLETLRGALPRRAVSPGSPALPPISASTTATAPRAR